MRGRLLAGFLLPIALVATLGATACSSSNGGALSDTGTPSEIPSEATKTVEFEGVLFTIPDSYQESSESSLVNTDGNSTVYTDNATGDYLIIAKVDISWGGAEGTEMPAEAVISAMKQSLGSLPEGQGSAAQEPFFASSEGWPVYGIDVFEAGGKYCASRVIGLDKSFLTVIAACSENNPDRLSKIVDSYVYRTEPSADLMLAAYADEYGEKAAAILSTEPLRAP